MKIRCKLKAVMEDRGLDNQSALAAEAGITATTLGKLYRNQFSRIDLETVDKLTDYLEMTEISELFELVESSD